MSLDVQELYHAALALPDEEQWQLVAALTSAIRVRGLTVPDEAWREEIWRRSTEYETGGIKVITRVELGAKVKALGGATGKSGPAADPGPNPPSARELRPFGLAKGEFIVPDEFDAPLPNDLLDAFEGR